MATDHDTRDDGRGHAQRSLSIGAPPALLLDAWADVEVQKQVLGHVAECISGDSTRSRWRADLPLGRSAEWESERVDAGPERVHHRMRGGRGVEVDTTLGVRPGPRDTGTEATLVVEYRMPGGALGDTVARWAGAAPDVLAGKALRRFKAYVETGEVPTLAHNPSTRRNDHEK